MKRSSADYDDTERRGSTKELEHAHVNELNTVQSEGAIDARLHLFDERQQRKIIWRIDRRLVLTLGFMYCVSLMDRTNLGLAAIAGMAVDLDLIGFRYSTITLVFFITYVLLQPLATVVLRKLGPRAFLPTITLLWGVTMVSLTHLFLTMLPSLPSNRSVSAFLRPGPKWSASVSSSVSSRPVSSLAVRTCLAAGTHVTSCRNEMPFSTSLVAWPPLSPVSLPTVSSK
jgi:hypothetical protein